MELTVASCFELGRALRDEDADSFLRHYDSLLGSLQFNFAGIQVHLHIQSITTHHIRTPTHPYRTHQVHPPTHTQYIPS